MRRICSSAPDLDALGVARLRDGVSTTRTLYRISVTRIEDMPPSLQSGVLAQGRAIYERPSGESETLASS